MGDYVTKISQQSLSFIMIDLNTLCSVARKVAFGPENTGFDPIAGL
jgi:hypothetical protein